MSLMNSLNKMKDRMYTKEVAEQAQRCQHFAEFYNTKYYAEFKDMLRKKAMNLGLDCKKSEEIIQANGARQFALEILHELETQEKYSREILNNN